MRIKPWWLPAGRTGLRYQDQEGRKQEGSRRRWAWRFDAGKRKELLFFLLGFPGVSAVKKKKIHLQCRRPAFDPGLGRSPGEGNGNPLQHSCLENPQGQRSLVGDSLWGCKESDTTKVIYNSLAFFPLMQGLRWSSGRPVVTGLRTKEKVWDR